MDGSQSESWDQLDSSGPRKRRFLDSNLVREEKRRKWLAKQEKKQRVERIEKSRREWLEQNSKFATLITEQHLQQVDKKHNSMISNMLQPYRNLQESRSNEVSDVMERYFIAEGTETVRLLIQESMSSRKERRFPPITVKSIFVKPSTFFESPTFLINDVEDAAKRNSKDSDSDQAPTPDFSVLIGSEDIQSHVVGFPFSRGALACGVVPSWSENRDWLLGYLRSHPRFANGANFLDQPLRLLALDGICDTANLGSIIRSASAFGVDALLLSNDCCDVWYRRAVRVSMGHCCRVPCVRVQSLADTLRELETNLGLTTYAAVVDTDADLVLEKVKHGEISSAWCCVMGNEGRGISKEVAQACKERIRIEMVDGVDSLSLPIATAILLHGLREREQS